MEDGGSSSGSVSGVTAGLEAAITEKQETEAKLAQAELRIAQLEQHINSGGGAPPSGLMSPRYSIVFISVMWQDGEKTLSLSSWCYQYLLWPCFSTRQQLESKLGRAPGAGLI